MDIHRDMPLEKAKKAAGLRALDYVLEGMTVGLGTGSTTSYFIDYLIAQYREGLNIRVVATSIISEQIARRGGIPTADVNEVTHLDLTVDGADEIDPKKRLIKGAGGALVREKIVASMSRKMVVIADSLKCVDKLGSCPLPVEVIPFGKAATKAHIKEMGFDGSYRKGKDGALYVTDNKNWVFDIVFTSPPPSPEELHEKLLSIPGVVETGFFFNLADAIVIGNPDGTTRTIE